MASTIWIISVPVLAFFFIAIVLICTAFVAWLRRSTPGSLLLGWFLLAVSLWTLTAGLDAASVNLTEKITWSKIEHIGINTAPVLIFLFVLHLSQQPKLIQLRKYGYLWVIPAITILLAFTNEAHHLIWTGFFPSPDPTSNLIIYQHGFWFWVALVYDYMLIIISTILLVHTLIKKDSIYASHAGLLLTALPFPWIGNILYNFELSPWPGFDLTPIGFGISGILFLWGIYNQRLINLSPVARDRLVESMRNGMLVFNWQNRVVDFNPAAVNLLTAKGFDLGDGLLYATLSDLVARNPELEPLQSEEMQNIVLPSLVKGEPYLDIVQQKLVDRRGKVKGRLLLLRDISEQKAMEEALVRHQRVLATVQERARMGRELHDSLGQVLNYINIQSKVILEQIEKNDTTTAAANVARLINVSQEANVDVRSFIHDTRPISSNQKAFLPALTQYIENFQSLTGIQVVFSQPAPELEAHISTEAKLQILRIIQESLSNIRKHAQAHSIQIIFSYMQGILQLVVADDGVGFEENSLPQEGHFGLSIIRERAKQIGGILEVFSKPGKGTQVILKLPLMNNPAQAELKKWKFMIVDDHPLIIEGIRNLLTAQGLEVVEIAHNGEEALQKLEQTVPDLILMDVHMPGLSGPDTVRQIKQRYPKVKVLMLTISDQEKDLQAAIQSGANGYMLKNQAPEQLFETLERLTREDLVISEEVTRKTLERRLETDEEPLEIKVTPRIFDLSRREIEILQRVVDGEGYKEIGAALNISPHTVKYHFNKILDVLAVQTRAEAIQVAIQNGLIKGHRKNDPQF